jgi:tetratricopeptide (TPR) repeat protein
MTRYQEWLGECLRIMGYIVSIKAGRPDEGIALNEEAVTYYRKLADAQPDLYRFQNRLAQLHNNIAASSWDLGKVEDAITAQRRALMSWQKSADTYPAVSQLANNVAFGLNNLGDFLNTNGRPAEALEALSRSRPIVQKLSESDPSSRGYPAILATNYLYTGKATAQLGMWSEAQESFEKAAAIWQRLADENPSSRNSYQGEAAATLGLFGQGLLSAGRAAEAATVFARERAIRQRLAVAEPANASNRGGLANCETNTAAAAIALGRLSEARACCDRAIAAIEDLLKGDPKNEAYANDLAMSLMRSGSVKAATGDNLGAAADWRRAALLYASHPPIYEAAIFRACCHGALAGLAAKPGSGVSDEEAAAYAEEAMAILHSAFAGGYRDLNLLKVEHGIEPLRSRADFRSMMMDMAFPAEPFAEAR